MSAEKKLPDYLNLNLPDWSDDEPPSPLSLPEIIALCEKMLPVWNKEREKNPPPIIDRSFSLVAEDLISDNSRGEK